MITRERLYQLKNLNAERQMWEQKLAEMKARRDCQKSLTDVDPTGVHGSGTSDNTGNLASAIADTEQIIADLIKRIEKEERFLIAYISDIDNSQLRQIVQYRCVDGKSWIQIGHIMSSTAEACKMTFYRAFPE